MSAIRSFIVVALYVQVVSCGSAAGEPCNQPQKPVYPDLPAKSEEATGLILITHGTNSNPASWGEDLAAKIQARLEAAETNAQWDIVVLDWEDITTPNGVQHGAKTVWFDGTPFETVRQNAMTIGGRLGKQISDEGYAKVHFIGHSNGCWLNDRAADKLRKVNAGVTIQQTFLDAYLPLNDKNEPIKIKDDLGDTANFAIHYVDNRELKLDDKTYNYTNADLKHAYNLDITSLDPDEPQSFPDFLDYHSWAHEWYRKTAKETPELAHGWGYLRSLESGQMPSFGDTIDDREVKKGTRHALPPPVPPGPAKQAEVEKCPGDESNQRRTTADTNNYCFSMDFRGGNTSSSGVTVDSETGSAFTLEADVNAAEPEAWIELGVYVPESAAMNILEFDYQISGSGQGWVQTCVDGELAFDHDERYARVFLTDPDAEVIILPLLSPGPHTLAFRLDAFSDDPDYLDTSTLTVSNVRLSYAPVITQTSVPALRGWGLVAMTLLLLAAGMLVLTQRRGTRA